MTRRVAQAESEDDAAEVPVWRKQRKQLVSIQIGRQSTGRPCSIFRQVAAATRAVHSNLGNMCVMNSALNSCSVTCDQHGSLSCHINVVLAAGCVQQHLDHKEVDEAGA